MSLQFLGVTYLIEETNANKFNMLSKSNFVLLLFLFKYSLSFFSFTSISLSFSLSYFNSFLLYSLFPIFLLFLFSLLDFGFTYFYYYLH